MTSAPEPIRPPDSTRPRPAVAVLFGIIVVMLTLACAECAARVAWAERNTVRTTLARNGGLLGRPQNLHAYQMVDPRQPDNWVLRPGFHQTLEQWMVSDGRLLSRQRMQEASARYHIAPDSVILRVNSHGFKGPELDANHSRLRVLAVGNSCTFGSAIDEFSYPRAMERAFERLGTPAEVVNAGVEGYHTWNVLARLDDFMAVRPELTVIYLGWNGLFQEKLYRGAARFSVAAQLVDRVAERIRDRRLQTDTAAALAAYRQPKRVDANDPLLGLLNHWSPSFMGEMEEIVDRLMRSGTRVVLVTLPALYQVHRVPTPAALAKGQLPTFTNNPLVLAHMTKEYNQRLRELAASRHIALIDLATWVDSTMQPADSFFMDAVHLTEPAQVRLGEHLAEQLLPLLPARRADKAPAP